MINLNRGINPKDIFVIIPAKNEELYVDLLIRKIIQLGLKNIVLVNDCSTDNTRAIAEKYKQVTVLDHLINLGPGAATQTGISYAMEENAKFMVTIDADLQHDPEDIIRLVNFMVDNQFDLVIGSRFKKQNKIPASRVFFNKAGNLISYFLTGIYLSDSQSGLKAIHRSFGEKLDLNYDGFEFCMEIIKQAKANEAKIGEMAANVSYTPETTKKGQNFMSGLRMLGRLISPFN